MHWIFSEMKIFYHDYQLKFRLHPEERRGALLKIEFEEGSVGFTDCHPWPEVGDLPLNEQINSMKKGNVTRLIECALEKAYEDAIARQKGIQLLKKMKVPSSHYLGFSVLDWTNNLANKILLEGFTHVKFKVGKKLDQEISQLVKEFCHSDLKVRLDFNNSVSAEEFIWFLQQIEPIKEKVDFIEDPFAFHLDSWSKIQQKGWKLACDREVSKAVGYPEAASYLIIKPALMSKNEIQQKAEGQTKIVTTYVAHPLEQMSAAYTAAQIDSTAQQMHGLLSHRLFATTPFSEKLNWYGPQFEAASGTGWGFDDELAQLSWTALS